MKRQYSVVMAFVSGHDISVAAGIVTGCRHWNQSCIIPRIGSNGRNRVVTTKRGGDDCRIANW